MKSLKLEKYEFEVTNFNDISTTRKISIDERQLLFQILNVIGSQHRDFAGPIDMIRLYDALKQDEIKLEDADFNRLKRAVDMVYLGTSEEIVRPLAQLKKIFNDKEED